MKEKKIILNILLLIINFTILINIKGYIAVSLLPGFVLWLYSSYLKGIKNNVIKIAIAPILIVVFTSISVLFFNNLDFIGLEQYQNIDQTIEQAQVIQQDLLREDQYGTNNYNIGTLDGSFSGMLKVAPKAVGTAIFRPFIWESANVTMGLSGLENLILIFTSLFIIIKSNPIKFFSVIFKSHSVVTLLDFCVIICFWSWHSKHKLWSSCKV